MDKIMKTVDYKIQLREKEIAEADRIVEQDKYARKPVEEEDVVSDESQDEADVPQAPKVDEAMKPKKKQKDQNLDPFFAEVPDETVEKRVVQRDGHVPKLQKNIEK